MIGLLDTGLSGPLAGSTRLSHRFWLDGDGRVADGPARPDLMGHGTALAGLIQAGCPSAPIVNAQVFGADGAAPPVAIAAGLDWLVAKGVRIVNMSFGLAEDRRILAEACSAAVRAGILLVAAVPAMGAMVFPAAYPGTVRVTGDGRCRPGEVSRIDDDRVHFGASPHLALKPETPWRRSAVAGASVATARVTARLAGLLLRFPGDDNARLLARLEEAALPLGPQREHLHVG
ncbi:conserved protein of unknown function [Magnetospirillum sp. XM-1]|uniref:subtilisin-like serine protease QhpE n=1 Tax=Magnetospirillum sp. XM-1 TaxID=1663591 RepID=UPI00073DF263|nr:S8 family serine peptidase [Magnetospirillum sp. XM-1]CUW39595.1 conserved protein of unknown function [Magnetospirillum sp. XM-1]